jgi:hypothetical protein
MTTKTVAKGCTAIQKMKPDIAFGKPVKRGATERVNFSERVYVM